MRLSFILGFAGAISLLSATAQDSSLVGLNALTEVEFSQLSQRDPNPLGEKALVGLAPVVLSSRPLLSRRERLVNEAILIEQGFTHVIHRKIHLPSEPGWHEETWFGVGRGGFHTADFAGATTGTAFKQVLLNFNFEQIVTASEFNGRSIDIAVAPKIFIQSGLIQ